MSAFIYAQSRSRCEKPYMKVFTLKYVTKVGRAAGRQDKSSLLDYGLNLYVYNKVQQYLLKRLAFFVFFVYNLGRL